ncbi:ribonuclease H [Senna tora]|uniref:Ribonuclease H n=1 Tax=Senna tora TaxID=362788 RepID=A0A834XD02_9FABA|nr:ribonuclease H [Senna tora]
MTTPPTSGDVSLQESDLPPSQEEEDNLKRSKKKVRIGDQTFTGEENNPARDEDWMNEDAEGPRTASRVSYRDAVRNKQQKADPGGKTEEEKENLQSGQNSEQTNSSDSESDEDENDEETEGDGVTGISVDKDAFDRPNFTLSDKEWKRLTRPFKKSLIIKLLGKKIGFQFLLKKVNQIWGRTGEIELVDLGNDYFLAKFDTYSDQDFALTGGPWIILDHYLIVRPWTSLFDPEEKIQKLAAWIHLPDLPIELYDKKVLYTIGSHVGRVLRIDTNTMTQSRGKYARICIELDLGKPLLSQYCVHGIARKIEYEGLHLICFECGVYGHDLENCPIWKEKKAKKEKEKLEKEKQGIKSSETEKEGNEEMGVAEPRYGGWMTVQRQRRQRRQRPNDHKASTTGGNIGGKSRFTVLDDEKLEEKDNSHNENAENVESEQAEPQSTPTKAIRGSKITNKDKEGLDTRVEMDIGSPTPKTISEKATNSVTNQRQNLNHKEKPPDTGKKKEIAQRSPRKKFDLAFKEIKRKQKLDFVCLFETRCSGLKAANIIKRLGFQNNEIVDAHGYAGGIWVVWNKEITATCDFNEIAATNEQRGGAEPRLQRCIHFQSWINECNLIDVRPAGPFFTWEGPKRPGQDKLFKRLDRVLCSAEWRTLFSDASAKCLTRIHSDHHPILLNTVEDETTPKNRPFRFEACWFQHKGFKDFIKNQWNVDRGHHHMLADLSKNLQKWNMEVFGDIKSRKNTIMRRLHGIQLSLDKKYNPFLAELGKSLSKDLEEVLNQEEALWFQKSRSMWIRDGDRNTRSQEIGRYLGADITQGRQTKSKFKHIIEKIQNRLSGWKASCLSLAGRATLVQSVLSTIPLYHMQHSMLPKGTINQIETLERDFLWGSSSEKRKLHQVKWDTVCLPRDLGGLGIKSLHSMNKAFLFKLAWNLFNNKNSLWVKVLSLKYKFDPHLCNYPICKSNDSRLWKEIVDIWPEFYQYVSWTIGNGNLINFWKDQWLNGFPNLAVFCNIEGLQTSGEKLIDFVDNEGQWKITDELASLPLEVVQKIQNISPPKEFLGPDVPCWKPEANGFFTVKSAYQSICNLNKETRSVWKQIWKTNTVPRNKTLLWRLGHDKLPTRNRIASWSNVSPLCPLYGKLRDSNMHAIRDCHMVAAILNAFLCPNIRALFFSLPTKDWISWNLKREVTFSGIQWNIIFPIGCSLIWNWRNKLCNDKEFTMPLEPHKVILHHAKSFGHAWSDDMIFPSVGSMQRKAHWTKPSLGWVKVNSDGAVCQNSKMSSCGGLLRDTTGKWICGFVANLGLSNVLSAELWGIYYGVKIAWEKGFRKIIVECDSFLAVKQLSGTTNNVNICHPVSHSIKDMLNFKWDVQIKLISRSENLCADTMAKKGLSLKNGLALLDDPPSYVSKLIEADFFGDIGPCDPGS